MSDYNGWKNRATWNCALHLGEEPYYWEVVEFMKNYKGKRPYIDFCRSSGLDKQKNPDGIRWCGSTIDYGALNEAMWEDAPLGRKP